MSKMLPLYSETAMMSQIDFLKSIFYENGRKEQIFIIDLYREPRYATKLNAKLYTRLKNDMRDYFGLKCLPPTYHKGEFWKSIFEHLKNKVDEDTLFTQGYRYTVNTEWKDSKYVHSETLRGR